MEWRHEAVRWFDQWLKGRDTGIMAEPRFAVYVRGMAPAGAGPRGGARGVAVRGGLADRADPGARAPPPAEPRAGGARRPRTPCTRSATCPRTASRPAARSCGTATWPPTSAPPTPGASSTKASPLAEDLEILGLPKALLQVSADAPLAQWFVRLSDVAPDGTVTLVAQAGQNGAHRESDEHPKALEPGQRVPPRDRDALHLLGVPQGASPALRGQQRAVADAVADALPGDHDPAPGPGHAPAPAGGPAARAGRSRASCPPAEDDPGLPGYGTLQEETTSGYGEISRIERDVANRSTRVIATNDGGRRYPWGESRFEEKITHEARDDRPAIASVRGEYRNTITLPGRVLVFEYEAQFRSDREHFHYTGTKRLRENGLLVREKTWNDAIPRDHQ